MNTSKPISTISYNTEDFLQCRLNSLKDSNVISVWHYICHLAEGDEGGSKDHIHLYIEPSKLLNTDSLRDILKEDDPFNAKPLGCLPFRNSARFGDWYLYAIHDPKYLAQKDMIKKYTYSPDGVRTSDTDELNYQIKMINLMDVSPYQSMIDAQLRGVRYEEFFARGTVPIAQIRNYKEAWKVIQQSLGLYKGDKDPMYDLDLYFGL